MVEGLGGSIRVDNDGRTTVTGAGSDIDYGATIAKIMEAKRQPAVRIENRIAENQTKVDALVELQNRLSTLEQAAEKLRGQPTFDKSGNVFEAKEGFLSATRADGEVASPATSIMTANVENAAQPGTQQIEVLRRAQGQQVASSSVSSSSADLNTAEGLGAGNFAGGDFVLNGRVISLAANDSLLDVRDKINAANSGDNATGVNAQIVSVSDTEKILTLTAEDGGESIGLDDDPNATGNTPLTDLGLTSSAATDDIANELREGQTSIFRVNGLSDGSVQETGGFSVSATAALDTISGVSSDNGAQIDFKVDNGLTTQTQTLTVDTTTASLDSVAQDVNANIFGVSARVVTDADGNRQLEFNAEYTGAVQRSDALATDTTTALDSLSNVESGTFNLRISNQHPDGTGGTTTTISVDTTTDSLDDVATKINGAGLNVTASTITVDGNSRLRIASNDGGKVSVSDVSGELTQDLGISASDDVPDLTISDNTGALASELNVQSADAVSRKTNTVDDLFQGVTLNLLKAERGTELQFDIERNEDAVNTAVQDFVTAYNGVKQFINAQRLETPLEGQDPNAEDSIVGALKGERVLREVEQKLSNVLANGATNVSGDFSVLAQVGVDFVDNDDITDQSLEDTLTINQKELNDRLLNDYGDLRKLFQFSFTSSSSNLQLTGSTGSTSAVDKFLEVTTDANGDVTNVAVGDTSGGTSNVTFDASGNRFTITEEALSGLSLLYSGGASQTEEVSVSTSTGVGSSAYFTSDNLSNTNFNDGLVQAEIDRITGRNSLEGQNPRLQEEVDRIDRSLTRERERLLQQFIAMEQALIELESARNRLDQFASAGSGNN